MSGRDIAKYTMAAFASLLLIATANADEWRVVKSSGQIWVASDVAQRASLGPTSTSVSGGATLITGKNGRAVLVRGKETFVIGPNAVVAVPKSTGRKHTTILVRAGKVAFDVDKQNVKHFAVETPFIAAVVKGTRFTVKITKNGGVVSVKRGLVEVTNLSNGQMVDIPSRQRASVSGRKGGLTISGFGKRAKVVQGVARSPLVAPLSRQEARALRAGTLGATIGRALGQTAEPTNANGIGIGVGLGGGNAGGNGKSNAGGNGKSNAGGNGKSNAGGNGKSNGN